MPVYNPALGTLYIVLGFLLLLLSVGQWMIQVGIALLGLYIINYGLILRNKRSLKYIIIYWLDQLKYF